MPLLHLKDGQADPAQNQNKKTETGSCNFARGESLPVIDAMIAATALTKNLMVITRKTTDLKRFEKRTRSISSTPKSARLLRALVVPDASLPL